MFHSGRRIAKRSTVALVFSFPEKKRQNDVEPRPEGKWPAALDVAPIKPVFSFFFFLFEKFAFRAGGAQAPIGFRLLAPL